MIENIYINNLQSSNITVNNELSVNQNVLINATSTINCIILSGSTNTQINFYNGDVLAWEVGTNLTSIDLVFYNPSLTIDQLVISNNTAQVAFNCNLLITGNLTASNFSNIGSFTAELSGDTTGSLTNYYQQIGNYISYYISATSWVTNNGYITMTVPISSPFSTSTSLSVYSDDYGYLLPEEAYFNGTNLTIYTKSFGYNITVAYYPFVLNYII